MKRAATHLLKLLVHVMKSATIHFMWNEVMGRITL